MVNWETLNSIVHGAGWVAAGSVGGYALFLYGLPLLSDISPFNKKIKSQRQLEEVVRKRAPNAGLDSSKIDSKYVHLLDTYSGNSSDNNGGNDIISFSDDKGCTVNNVDHELCHIKNRDCDRKTDRDLYYFFVSEPRAILYEVFGLKVGWKK
jgi:hypothetical protein